MADYRPLVLSGTAASSIITELPTSSILIADGIRAGASALSISGHLELIGGLSGTPSVSSTTVSSTAFTGGTLKGASVSATTVSSVAFTGKTYDASTSITTPRVVAIGSIPAGTASIIATTVSSLSVSADTKVITPVASATVFSGLEINGMPYPPPFVYVEMDAAGTDSTNEQNFALGAATTVVSGNSNHITWNDTEKYFTVSATGTYEIIGNFAFDSGSQSDPLEITSKKNGVDVHIISPKQYGATGPNENSFHSILTAVAGDYITVTLHMDDGGSKTGHLESGSNLTLKRIK